MDVFKDANVLLTGGAGFIGFHLCRKILALGANVFIYDDLSTEKTKNVKDLPTQGVRFIKGDVRHLEKTENKIEDCKTIFHLAAQCNVAYSMKNPIEDFEINALGTLKVLEKARKMDARVVYASTSAVYGNPQKTPTSEDHSIRPISFYGLSKVAGEEECLFYYRTYNLPVVMLRLFNVYGPRGHGVAADFLHGLRKNPNELRILGTGNQSRDFICISDVVEAFILSAQSKNALGQAYNVGSGTNIFVRKLADIMIELLGLKGVTRVSCTGGEAWEGDLKMNYADISKAQKDLNWQPKVQLTDGLTTLIREEKA
jgi:UDP-glucose 4-epimerase